MIDPDNDNIALKRTGSIGSSAVLSGATATTPAPRHSSNQPGHLAELQSIRGLAALVVLLHHCSFVFITSQWFHYATEIPLNAHAAVMLFFVLSGYVLTRALSDHEVSLGRAVTFYAKRFCRILPAMWLASLAALFYQGVIDPIVPTLHSSEWFSVFYTDQPFTARGGLRLLTLYDTSKLPPLWSIKVELIASMLLPAIVFSINRGWGLRLLALATAAGLAFDGARYGLAYAIYLPGFVLGGLMFRHQRQIGVYLGHPLTLCLSFAVLAFFRRIDTDWRFDTNYFAAVPAIVESLAAAFLIAGVVHRRIWVLRNRFLVWLGDVSYSLYLLHFVVMATAAKVIAQAVVDEDLRPLMLMAATVILTLPLAALSFRWIETPGIILGKRLVNFVRRTNHSALVYRT